MSNLPDRHKAPRWPIRETSGNSVMAALLIIGILFGFVIISITVDVLIIANGGHLCFSHDGISCNSREEAMPDGTR
jgi:hypothetical protein